MSEEPEVSPVHSEEEEEEEEVDPKKKTTPERSVKMLEQSLAELPKAMRILTLALRSLYAEDNVGNDDEVLVRYVMKYRLGIRRGVGQVCDEVLVRYVMRCWLSMW